MTIAFRFQFKEQTPGEVYRLLDLYKDKWRVFSRYLFRIHRDEDTYLRLKRIRQNLPRSFVLEEVIERVDGVDATAARMLMDAGVLFDRSPFDFRTFVLAVIGVDYQE